MNIIACIKSAINSNEITSNNIINKHIQYKIHVRAYSCCSIKYTTQNTQPLYHTYNKNYNM